MNKEVIKIQKHELYIIKPNTCPYCDKGIDPITKSKLKGRWCLHHRHVTASDEEYCDISKPEEYVALLASTHKVLHFLYIYWKKDPSILERIEAEFKKWY